MNKKFENVSTLFYFLGHMDSYSCYHSPADRVMKLQWERRFLPDRNEKAILLLSGTERVKGIEEKG